MKRFLLIGFRSRNEASACNRQSPTRTTRSLLDGLSSPRGDFSPEAARAILALQFDDVDKERMHQLALKAQDGELTPREQAEIESYRRIGCVLGVLWSKARLSLKRAGRDAEHGHRA